MKDILIGDGLDEVKFGMERQEVVKIYGEPDEVEILEFDAEDEKLEIWHYDSKDLSVAFDEANDWLLTSITVSSEEYLFEEKLKVGDSYKDVMTFLKSLELEGIEETEDIDEESKEKIKEVYVAEANVTFWFDQKDKVTEIVWGVIYDFEDDEEE